MERATTSLPTPVSPVIRTFALDRAAHSISSRSIWIAGVFPRRRTSDNDTKLTTSLSERSHQCRKAQSCCSSSAAADLRQGNFEGKLTGSEAYEICPSCRKLY